MKIAMFGHKRVPSREGGVEVVTEQLSLRLAARGHKVCLYNRGGRTAADVGLGNSAEKALEGIEIKTVPTIEKKGIAAVSSSFFAALAAAFSDAEVVHIHAEGPAAMCWLPRLRGKRVIVTVHGLDWQRDKWKNGFGARYIKLGEKMAVRFAHEIIVLSESVGQYFLESYGRETHFIPNGAEQPQHLPAALIKERFGLEEGEYILYLGRLVPEKAVHQLIEAYRAVDTHRKLVIAGGSSDTDEYVERLHALAAGDERIIFTGFVQGRMLQELYSNAYIYVLPSLLEGMPLSLLEAMSHGLCCLVSDIPECAQVVGDKALTFPAGDAAALRDSLQRICNDAALREELARSAAERVLSRYSWDRVVDATLELYKEKRQ